MRDVNYQHQCDCGAACERCTFFFQLVVDHEALTRDKQEHVRASW